MFLRVVQLLPLFILPASASPYAFERLTFPESYYHPYDINDGGVIVGDGTAHGARAFVSDQAGVQFPIQAVESVTPAVNNLGQIAGYYSPSPAFVITFGVLISGGQMTTYDLPIPGCMPITAPFCHGGALYGLNDKGEVVGVGGSGAFIESNGIYRFPALPVPGGLQNIRINNADHLIGLFSASGGRISFINLDGSWAVLSVPGADDTAVFDINNSDTISGTYRINGIDHGFVWTNGVFTFLDEPGATFTTVNGLNDLGQVVGTSSLGPFIATPVAIPEAGTASYLVSAFAAAVAFGVRRRTHA